MCSNTELKKKCNSTVCPRHMLYLPTLYPLLVERADAEARFEVGTENAL